MVHEVAPMLMPVTWIVLPTAVTVPPGQLDVVKPGALPVVDGVDQPAGTASVSSPLVRVVVPVYVKTTVLPVDERTAVVGAAVIVPVPSAPTTICGELARLVSVPSEFDRSWAVKVLSPPVEG